MTERTTVDGYYLHVGPSILPRRRRARPMRLAEAVHRAHGLRYAVVYRLDGGRPIPIVADAGNPDEVIHLPSGIRMRRHELLAAVVAAGLAATTR